MATATNCSDDWLRETSSMIGLISQACAADAAPYTSIASIAPAMSIAVRHRVAKQAAERVHQVDGATSAV